MSIQPLDMKILWGKANARCALCPNKEKVVAETPENKGRTDILFGEMCHIVGEKEGAARGKSSMPMGDRNQYHNLILLCANHHTQIDKDEATYTVEKLHQIKTEHELWIDSRLDEAVTLENSLYARLVNLIADQLQLHRWPTVSNCAIRRMLPGWFVDGAEVVSVELFKVNWPQKDVDLESALKNLASHLNALIKLFMQNTQLDLSGKMHMEIKRYRSFEIGTQEHDKALAQYDLWEAQSGAALCNLVVALNELAEAVRQRLNPKFFLLEGKFSVSDQLGVTNDMVPMEYIPESYRPIPA